MKLIPLFGIFALLAPLTSQAAQILITDSNLLSGLAGVPGSGTASANVNVSSVASTSDYGAERSTDGVGTTNSDFVFAYVPTVNTADQILAITGFNSSIATIRIWSASDLAPAFVTIYSSITSQTSLDPGDYSLLYAQATLGYGNLNFIGSPINGNSGYYEFSLNAPVGTQSLLFNFGTLNGGASGYTDHAFVRIAEIQAFAVPEPSPWAMMLGGLGILFVIQRTRRLAQS